MELIIFVKPGITSLTNVQCSKNLFEIFLDKGIFVRYNQIIENGCSQTSVYKLILYREGKNKNEQTE